MNNLMDNSKLKVLLYSDGSHQAFSAAVYAATLLRSIPNMHLTILQVYEIDEGSKGVKYSWIELRKKYQPYHWKCSLDKDKSWLNTWPAAPNTKWLKNILNGSEQEIKKTFAEILAAANNIFSKNLNVCQQNLCLNVSCDETVSTSEKVEVIADYAAKNFYQLIIIGSRGPSKLNRLVFGSFSYEMLHKCAIPVVLIKKLPQEFIDSFLAETLSLQEINIKQRSVIPWRKRN